MTPIHASMQRTPKRARIVVVVAAITVVAATTTFSTGPVAAQAAPAAPAAPAGLLSITPQRLLDTRFQGGPVTAGTIREVGLHDRPDIPIFALAAVLNVTAVDPASDGYLTVYPCIEAPSNTSILNYRAHQTVAGSVHVSIGDAKVCVFTSATTDIIVDITGVYDHSAPSTLVLLEQHRVLDTRSGLSAAALNYGPGVAAATSGDACAPQGSMAGGAAHGFVQDSLVCTSTSTDPQPRWRLGGPLFHGRSRQVTFTDLPAGTTAVALNVTAVNPLEDGFITIGSCNAAPPNVSTLNYTAGRTVANGAVATLDPGDTICLSASGTTHVLVDLNAAYAPGGLSIVALEPARVLDTRQDGPGARLVPGGVVGAQVAGTVAPDNTAAAVLTVTVSDPADAGFVTVFQCRNDPSDISTVNFAAHQTVANTTIAPLAAGGDICVTGTAATDVIIDVDDPFVFR